MHIIVKILKVMAFKVDFIKIVLRVKILAIRLFFLEKVFH